MNHFSVLCDGFVPAVLEETLEGNGVGVVIHRPAWLAGTPQRREFNLPDAPRGYRNAMDQRDQILMQHLNTSNQRNQEFPPRVTLALLAYNQEDYVGQAIDSAFGQTYSHLEIILSDDCSSDRTYDVMKRAASAYKGPHRVVVNRNQKNLNIGDHINAIARLASGDLIILAAGDDISLPERTEKLVDRWQRTGRRPAVLCSDFQPIDASSRPLESHRERIYRGPFDISAMALGDIRVLGATAAVSRDVFSQFPPLDCSVRHEDRVLPFRALILGGSVEVVEEKLVRYRVAGGISRGKVSSARQYVFKHVPAHALRTMPDAVQRLSDLNFSVPNEKRLHRLCLSTIAHQNALIEISRSSGLQVELALARGIRGGGRIKPLTSFYLKRRLFIAFDLYFRIKNHF